jgi:hypothetical protein
MSPPEVWGPAVWRLFHVLCEKLNENAFQSIGPGLFNIIVRICKFLPCPDCASDAGKFLANIKISELKNKTELKNVFYVFHNYVNTKKRKQLFNYSNITNYANYNLINVINNFIANYHTKGNMKLITESFQRQFVINDFKKWFSYAFKAFVTVHNIPNPLPVPSVQEEEVKEEEVKEEEVKEEVTEEEVKEEEVTEEEVTEEEVTEEEVKEEIPTVETEIAVEEIKKALEEVVVVELIVQSVGEKEETIKSKKGKKKGKNKK